MFTKVKDFLVKIVKENIFPLNYTCNCCDREIFNKKYFCDECKTEIYKIDENKCNHCGRKTAYQVEYCDSCIDKNLAFTEARSLYEYKGKIKKIIKDIKYFDKTYLLDIFIDDLKELYYSRFMSCEVVVGVPMTTQAVKERGYNQAQVLAQKLSKELNLPYSEDIVIKVKDTERQATLDVNERSKNLKGAFKVNKQLLKYKNVLLVDDVLTTGTTCNMISELLLKKGVEKVFVLTIASVQREYEKEI